MFRKRNKRPEGSTSRQRAEAGAEAQDESSSSVVSDLLALRRLKGASEGPSAAGIQADKLNAGSSSASTSQKRKAPDAAPEAAAAAPAEGLSSLAKKNNFTQQMNLVDVDKHMMEYIENEMRKKQKAGGGQAEEQSSKPLDPRDALYLIDDKYKINEGPKQEGNLTGSTAMLTAIPEVDLGIDSRLRNIEATEKAKRSLYEAEQLAASRAGPTRAQVEADNYARQRFHQPEVRDASGALAHAKQTDYERDAAELLRQAREAAAKKKKAGGQLNQDELDLAEEQEVIEVERKKVNELKSTDDQVVARFKNRQRDNNAKHQKGIVWNR